MTKKEVIETFRLYQKMVEDKAKQELEDKDLRQRFLAGLFLFFVMYSVLMTLSLIFQYLEI